MRICCRLSQMKALFEHSIRSLTKAVKMKILLITLIVLISTTAFSSEYSGVEVLKYLDVKEYSGLTKSGDLCYVNVEDMSLGSKSIMVTIGNPNDYYSDTAMFNGMTSNRLKSLKENEEGIEIFVQNNPFGPFNTHLRSKLTIEKKGGGQELVINIKNKVRVLGIYWRKSDRKNCRIVL